MTLVVISRVLKIRSVEVDDVGIAWAMFDTSWRISMRMVPSFEMRGVTSRPTPIFFRSTVRNGLELESPSTSPVATGTS